MAGKLLLLSLFFYIDGEMLVSTMQERLPGFPNSSDRILSSLHFI